MFTKLKSLYKNSTITSQPSNVGTAKNYYWFCDQQKQEWIGIPKEEISDTEFTLLKTLFDYKVVNLPAISRSYDAERWYNFLFFDGEPPIKDNQLFRITQFVYSGEMIDSNELNIALIGFFSSKSIIVWLDSFSGLIIETNSTLFVSDYLSIVQTLESEFFITPYFFVGKKRCCHNEIPLLFAKERRMFMQGRELLPTETVYVYEKVFSILVATQLSDELNEYVLKELFPVFTDDPDLLVTLKAYLENNFNLSLTAKKLFIHRNSLQYRLDKFSEKTSINLKDFYSAMAVYIACLLYEHS